MLFSPLSVCITTKEIESQYEKTLDEEEQRIIYQRKLLLLNTRKTYEKEIENLIQMKNALLQNKVDASKKDLEMMLNKYEKQVSFLFYNSMNSYGYARYIKIFI